MISAKLILNLLTAIAGYTGYAIPGDPPRITQLPHNILEQRVCGRPCQVFGFTLPDGEVLIDGSLAVGTDPVATSILVHELTHFLQITSVTRSAPLNCRVWSDREREAFSVQTRWLRDTSGSMQEFSVEMTRINFGGMNAACVDGPAPMTGNASQ